MKKLYMAIGGIMCIILLGLICSHKKQVVWQQFEGCTCKCPVEK
jgi:hypothetical protein